MDFIKKISFKYYLLFFAFLFLKISVTFSQPKPPEPYWSSSKIFWGGNLGGVSFSNVGTYIDVSPHIGYRFTEKLSGGVGFIYQYISQYGLRSHNYGGKVFGRYVIWKGIFAHTEYQALNMKRYYFDPVTRDVVGSSRAWTGSMYVGGGIQQNLGGNGIIYAMALYDLNYQAGISPHSSPVYFTVGIGMGF